MHDWDSSRFQIFLSCKLTGTQFWYEMTVLGFPVHERLVVLIAVTVVVDPYSPPPPIDPVHVVIVFAALFSVYVVVFHCVSY